MQYYQVLPGGRIQTVVRSFRDPGSERAVTIISTIHEGSKAYYAGIRKRVEQHEQRGALVVAEGFREKQSVSDHYPELGTAERRFYQGVSELNGVWNQQWLLTNRPEWILADLRMDEFLQRTRAIYPGLAARFAFQEGAGLTPEQEAWYADIHIRLFDGIVQNPETFRAFAVMVTEDTRADLETWISYASTAEGQLRSRFDAVAGLVPEVRTAVEAFLRLVCAEREQFVLHTLEDQAADLCIVYGTGHGEAFEEMLVQRGFVAGEFQWVDALAIPGPQDAEMMLWARDVIARSGLLELEQEKANLEDDILQHQIALLSQEGE